MWRRKTTISNLTKETVPQAKYRQLCEVEPSIPLFSKDWWLDANCGKNGWGVVLVLEGDCVTASLPFSLERRLGQTYLRMPPGTPWLGPWIRPTAAQKYANRLSHEHGVLLELIDQLPPMSFFQQHFSCEQTNWLPFHWRGFCQTTRYTYVIDLSKDLSTVSSEFKSNARGKIRKAEKAVVVGSTTEIGRFERLLSLTFERQGLRSPLSRAHLERIDSALDVHGARRIFVATDADGRDHSALYLVWDNLSAYVHMVGEDPKLRSSGAGILLAWEAIRYAKEELLLPRFDFEGSMIESVESVRRELGAKQVPYSCVWKDDRSNWSKRVLQLVSLWRRVWSHIERRRGELDG